MSLKVWLPLNGDLKNNSVIDLDIVNNKAVADASGKIGKCYQFNGSDSFISLTSSELYTILNGSGQPFSITMWVYHSDSTRAILFGDFSVSGGNNFNIELTTGHALRWYWGTPDINISAMNINVNVWHHVAFTYSGTVLKGYIDGIEKYTNTITLSVKNRSSGPYYLGRDGRTGTTAFNGKMNDFRIYNHCLSPLEVKEISQGLVLHYKLNDSYIEETTNLFTENPCKNGSLASHGSFIENGKGVKIDWTSNAGDTYWYLILKEQNLVEGEIYTLSFQCFGLSNTAVAFRWCDLPNYTIYLKNGFNSYTFNMPSKNIANPFFDDVNRDTTLSNLQLWNFQLEKKDHATPYTPNSRESNNIIQDSSGYNHNGTIIGDLTCVSDTKRYLTSIKLNCSDPTTNNNTGLCYIWSQFSLTTPSKMTIAWWAKPESGYGGSTAHAAFCTSNKDTVPDDYNTTAFHHRDNGFDIYPSDGSGVKRLSFVYTQNTWHHYAITYDGTTARAYQDGIEKSSITIGAGKTLASFSQLYIGFSKAGGVWRKTLGSYSDFRIYVTQLLDVDIKKLYNTSMSIDNNQNIHIFESNENKVNKLTKSGILYDGITESYLTLSDGSNWKLLLYHYVDYGNNLFTSSNATYCNDFGLYSRLQDINKYIYDGKYEFYVIQDGTEYRWTQTSQPTASSIAGLTTVSGYTNPVNGLAKANQSNTYIGYGSWWGACGCWTKYSTGGKTGIPGFGPHDAQGICEKYLALYVRIPSNKNAKLKDSFAEVNELIER